MISNQISQNPLFSFMRQPKIFIKLPSGGKFWNQGSLSIPETGEFPVYSMTAKDELMFKTPDALMNGQAIVDVIQSCIPNIKNAWDTPAIDLDTILIAMRLATYGEKMTVSNTIPVLEEEVDFELDLRMLLDQQQNSTWMDQIIIDENFIIYVKPLTFKNITQIGIRKFETTKILNIVNDEKYSEEEKIKYFRESFDKLTQITIDLVADSIEKIYANGTFVHEKKYIQEFVANADKDVYDTIKNHLNHLSEHNGLKPLVFETTEEQQSRGAPATYSIPINFNNADFFGNGF
jgi:hypothetical protein